jgi:hypothetical protein
MAVAGEGIERHVAEDADLGEFVLDCAHRLADEVVGIDGFRALLVAQGRICVGEERDAGDVELHGALGLAHDLVHRETVDARHRGDRGALIVTFRDEERPDQVVGRQHILAHHAAGPFRLAVAARANRKVEARGGRRGFEPRGVAHFDRTPEFDCHGIASFDPPDRICCNSSI